MLLTLLLNDVGFENKPYMSVKFLLILLCLVRNMQHGEPYLEFQNSWNLFPREVKLRNMKQPEFDPTLLVPGVLLRSCTFIYAHMLSLGNTCTCTSPPTLSSSFNKSKTQIGTAPYFLLVSPPLLHVLPCIFWLSECIEVCMPVVGTKSSDRHIHTIVLPSLHQWFPHQFLQAGQKSCRSKSWLISL